MRKEFRCIRCHKAIGIESPSEPSNEIPETVLEFPCPFCETSNAVQWPSGAKYIVVPAD